jgi:hypothetical protein
MFKFPRTPHLEGSRKQPGDEDLEGIRFVEIANKPLVIEEKVDGANAGISFGEDGALLLQSRGHYLVGGPREKHFNLFKTWANTHQESLREALGSRYILYGEWMYAKHTVYYDQLPHLFLEFDILDTQDEIFLDTPRRRELLKGTPIVSAPVIAEGRFKHLSEVTGKLVHSLYKSDHWRESLTRTCETERLDPKRALAETDDSDLAEGLYLKVEENGRVVDRLKFVRASFNNAILDSGSHWLNRPILPNGLAEGVDIFGA